MENTRQDSVRQTIIISFFVILAAQLNLDILTTDFRVSLGILVFPTAVFLIGKIPILPVTFLSGLGVYFSRIALSFGDTEQLLRACRGYLPEILFYLSYGILSYIYYRTIKYQFPGQHSYTVLFFLDYAANFIELSFRLKADVLHVPLLLNLFLVALIRTFLLYILIAGLGRYRLVLIRKEHADRYQRLVLLISRLNEEVIWMKKNTSLIEETMQRSYGLYSEIQKSQADPELSMAALSVAKDIHEIKKEYFLILRGISETLDLNLNDDGMSFQDIMTLLKNSTAVFAEENHIRLEMDMHCRDSVLTDKHYFLLSVFRNLLTNALEACESKESSISFVQDSDGENYIFTVTDNGPGIPKENLADIFTPGFSTKINFDTGEINRGLGLNLVKDVIENQLSGTISVVSSPGCTKFTVCIPKNKLEVQ